MPADSGLIVDGLTVAIGGRELVRNVSLAIGKGGSMGLVGESGSGKTLTARAILGLLPAGAAATGRIELDGDVLSDLTPEQRATARGSRIGMIFQDPMASLNPVLRVGSAVAQVIRSHERVDAGTAWRRAITMLERVGIPDARQRARAYPHQFSGGMRQRIMIAMALAARPGLLLADEPTTALDVVVQHGILRLLDGLRRSEAMSLLFVSHDLAVVARVCERVAVMYAGEIVEEGPTRTILERPLMPYTQGLIASVPRPAGSGRLAAIPGQPPPAGSSDPGCRFAPRCGLVIDRCRRETVALSSVGLGHRARCLRSEVLAAAAAQRQPELKIATHRVPAVAATGHG